MVVEWIWFSRVALAIWHSSHSLQVGFRMAVLKALNGSQAGREYPLGPGQFLIGRHPGCQVVIDVNAVSRHHAKIHLTDNKFVVEDLNSRNGTVINERLIRQPTALKNGDILKVCDVELRFLDGSNDLPANDRMDSSYIRKSGVLGLGRILFDDKRRDHPTTIINKLELGSRIQGSTSTPEAKLKALMEITKSLSKVLSIDEVLPKVLDSLFSIFSQADRGFIVVQEPNGELVPMAARTRNQNSDETIRISREIVGHVLSTKEAILSADAAMDERFDISASVASLRIRSLMCAPLVDGEGEVFGVLQIDTLSQASKFNSDDLDVLATVALQAGVAIDNARLHEAALNQREVARDLELAHEVQHGFLPLSRPIVPGYEFFDYYQPANEIGGDFYDYVLLPGGKVAVVVADVVGHGIAAALMMARISSETRFSLVRESNLGEAVRQLNDTIFNLKLDRFVTMLILVFDPASSKVQMVNAGHKGPMLVRKSGQVTFVDHKDAGLPLGISVDFGYSVMEFDFVAGDHVVLFTDGLYECMDAKEEQLGTKRMAEFAKKLAKRTSESLVKGLLELVLKHVGSLDVDDDICAVAIGKAG